MAHVVLLLQDLSTWPSCCYSGGSVGGFKQNHPKRWLLHCMHGISGENISSHTGLIRESLSMHYPQICALYLLFYRPFELFPSIFFFIYSFPHLKGERFGICSFNAFNKNTNRKDFLLYLEGAGDASTDSIVHSCLCSIKAKLSSDQQFQRACFPLN